MPLTLSLSLPLPTPGVVSFMLPDSCCSAATLPVCWACAAVLVASMRQGLSLVLAGGSLLMAFQHSDNALALLPSFPPSLRGHLAGLSQRHLWRRLRLEVAALHCEAAPPQLSGCGTGLLSFPPSATAGLLAVTEAVVFGAVVPAGPPGQPLAGAVV